MDYRTAKDRFTSEEARTLERLHNDIYAEARHAAEAHRQVRSSLCSDHKHVILVFLSSDIKNNIKQSEKYFLR